MKNLNTYQKSALAIAGVLILFIQLIKFSDEGIDGASWILSFAISALLFLPILSDADRVAEKIKEITAKSNQVIASKSHPQSNPDTAGGLFKELGPKAEKLHKLIADKSAVEGVPFFSVISDRWYPNIAAIVVFTCGVAKKCDDHNYYASDEFKKLNGMLFNLIMSISKHQDKLVGGVQTEDDLMRHSMSIISNARKSADAMFEKIANKQADADSPLHKFIQETCGFTDDFYTELELDVKRQINGLFISYSNNTRLL